jgi:hypothetical protein
VQSATTVADVSARIGRRLSWELRGLSDLAQLFTRFGVSEQIGHIPDSHLRVIRTTVTPFQLASSRPSVKALMGTYLSMGLLHGLRDAVGQLCRRCP